MKNITDINQTFRSATEDEEFAEALDIVRMNAEGKIWVIGGFVFRSIASLLYGIPRPEADMDFIIERPIQTIRLPEGWNIKQNRFGNPKFVSGSRGIDFVPLMNIHSIRERGLESTIDNYLSGVPLTIQSIVYDVEERRLRGDIGIRALQEKTIAINNRAFAEYAAQKKGISVEAMMHEKAKDLGFRVIV